jgi:hypothetical protein
MPGSKVTDPDRCHGMHPRISESTAQMTRL